MSDLPILYGYDPSSYVFSVRILLAEKGVDCNRVPVNVIAGEPRSEAHRRLHPFGKVPVFVHGDLRILETAAILRYINDAFEGPSFVPDDPVDRARMDMAMGLHDSYGYPAIVRVVGYHRFPVYSGHPTRADVEHELDGLHTLFTELMRNRGDADFLAGERPSLADIFVAPACFYLELVGESARFAEIPGFEAWWQRVKTLAGYRASIPDLSEWGERMEA